MEIINKLTFSELDRIFREHNEKNSVTSQFDDPSALTGVVVFKDAGANKGYSLESRSYAFSSDNKFFIAEMGGNSIFSQNLDKTDEIRLDWYLPSKDWEIDYCYIKEN